MCNRTNSRPVPSIAECCIDRAALPRYTKYMSATLKEPLCACLAVSLGLPHELPKPKSWHMQNWQLRCGSLRSTCWCHKTIEKQLKQLMKFSGLTMCSMNKYSGEATPYHSMAPSGYNWQVSSWHFSEDQAIVSIKRRVSLCSLVVHMAWPVWSSMHVGLGCCDTSEQD